MPQTDPATGLDQAVLEVRAANGTVFRIITEIGPTATNVRFFQANLSLNSQYYVGDWRIDTLLNLIVTNGPLKGLTLYGGQQEWYVDGTTLSVILAWLNHWTEQAHLYKQHDYKPHVAKGGKG